MKLSAFKRTGEKKSEITKIRISQDIPGVIYGPKHKNENIFIKGDAFGAALRQIPKGKLATTVFDLNLDGKDYKAIVKDIQYHRTTYNILHIDFEIVEKDVPITVNVPITFKNQMDCAGVKLGGFLRQVIRAVKVRCLLKDLPKEFIIDVKEMNILDSRRLSDLVFPKNVHPLANLKEVAAVVAKR